MNAQNAAAGRPGLREAEQHKQNMHRRYLLEQGRKGFRLCLLVRWHGTMLPILLSTPVMWVSMALFIGCSILREDAIVDHTKVLGQAIGFVLVFYVGHNFNRAQQQYQNTMECVNSITSTAMCVRHQIRGRCEPVSIRYLNAALLLGFMDMSECLPWETVREVLTTYQLLTEEEMAKLSELGLLRAPCGAAAFEVINWAMADVKRCEFDRPEADGPVAGTWTVSGILGRMCGLQNRLAAMHGLAMQPVPFVYVHLLYSLLWLYLPLSAVTWGLNSDSSDYGINEPLSFAVGLLTVIVNNVFFICLATVGQQLGEPFGNDLLDFQVLRYVKQCIWLSAQVVMKRDQTVEDHSLAWTQMVHQDVFGDHGAWPSHEQLQETLNEQYELRQSPYSRLRQKNSLQTASNPFEMGSSIEVPITRDWVGDVTPQKKDSCAELNKGIGKGSPSWHAERLPLVKQLLFLMDLDRDGTVTGAELCRYWSAVTGKPIDSVADIEDPAIARLAGQGMEEMEAMMVLRMDPETLRRQLDVLAKDHPADDEYRRWLVNRSSVDAPTTPG